MDAPLCGASWKGKSHGCGASILAGPSSTVARDVFYYRNLDLGQRLTATLRRFDRVGENIILHTALTAESDGASLAEIFTAKRVLR